MKITKQYSRNKKIIGETGPEAGDAVRVAENYIQQILSALQFLSSNKLEFYQQLWSELHGIRLSEAPRLQPCLTCGLELVVTLIGVTLDQLG